MNRRLTRSRNGMIGGVAAGVATWINADPALVRIAWALLVPLTSGAALLAYIVAWVVVPEEPKSPAAALDAADDVEAPVTEEPEPRPTDEGQAALLIGGGLVLIGLWFLVREFLPRIDWSFVWPLILVGVGVLILLGAARRRLAIRATAATAIRLELSRFEASAQFPSVGTDSAVSAL